MPQPIYQFNPFNGTAPIINLALANGFPPPTYIPLLRSFMDRYHVISMLPPALWPDTQPPDEIRSWPVDITQPLLQGIRDYDLQQIIAIGHSFGGIGSLLAAIEAPERFKALILLDPTILSDERMSMLDQLRAMNALDQMPLAARAIKRQDDFASVEEAFGYFRSKPLFADWSDEVLRLYVEQGTKPTQSGVRLWWSPKWEAYYFKAGYTGIWEDLPKLRGLLPILTLRGTTSDTFLAETAERLCALLPDMTYVEIEGHGHLFPQTAPDQTAAVINEWIAQL
ncbi:MAG: alpha/beta hydrolase [Anaerolineae bacterium]|jgi:pimeloyl-ACP methyl ester carboxylesterase|nr:alpha/beta hydrolase [Anaerolineae bacterium]